MQIAIDGPSGAGKSTLARAVAVALRLPYVDTGAMYRAVAWSAMVADAKSTEQVEQLLAEMDLVIVTDPAAFRVLVGGEDVTELLRQPAVSKRASEVAQIVRVRQWLVAKQRQLAAAGAVLEGRDIGTVVLPDADVKLFITAPEEVRLQRRAAQLVAVSPAEIVADVRERDRRDRQRVTSPLRAADDAMVIDTGSETVEASLARILGEIARQQGASDV